MSGPLELLGVAILCAIFGYILGHRARVTDQSIRIFEPGLMKRFEILKEKEARLEPQHRALAAERQALATQEWELKSREMEAKEVARKLEALRGDPARQRVIWLAAQLAAHLDADDVARLVTRDSAAVDALAQADAADGAGGAGAGGAG